METNHKVYDLIVLGGGPAGLTAVLYASRAGLKTLLCEAYFCGGKMMSTSDIENWPGEKKTTGADLSAQMYEHALSFGAEEAYVNIVKVTKEGDLFELTAENGQHYQSKTLICATGTVERKLGIEGEEELAGLGVSYCAVCDGAFFKDKVVVVIGGGNSAFEEAVYLTQYAKEVHICVRRDVARADAIVVQHAEENPKITIHYHYVPQRMVKDEATGRLGAVEFKHAESGETIVLACEGAFPFVGLKPNTTYIESLGVQNKAGFIETKPDMSTRVEGLFAAGDCRDTSLRQIVTATGDGAMAGQMAARYLQEQAKKHLSEKKD